MGTPHVFGDVVAAGALGQARGRAQVRSYKGPMGAQWTGGRARPRLARPRSRPRALLQGPDGTRRTTPGL